MKKRDKRPRRVQLTREEVIKRMKTFSERKEQFLEEIYVRQSIEAGLVASKAGKTIDVIDVRKRFGLPM